MTASNPGRSDLLARAVARALAVARWEVADLMARRSRDLAPDLLQGRAAELALSPMAADQILSLVLEAAAKDIREGRVPLADPSVLQGPTPDDIARLSFHHLAADGGAAAFVHDLELVRDLEARHAGTGVRSAELAERLAEDAALQDMLWDDPRIPAGREERRLMAASVATILRRAHELEARGRSASGRHEPEALDADDLRRPPILLGAADHGRLLSLAFATLLSEPRAAAPLLEEIDRATVMPDDDLPSDVVRLGSWVEYSDLLAGGAERVRLVEQQDGPCAISVLSPTGSALIGLSAGQTILWKDHLGLERLLAVKAVVSTAAAFP